MTVRYKLNGVDITKYVFDRSNVPFVSRNRDWTITSDGFECSISKSSTTIPNVGDLLEVYNDSTSEYLGIIERAKTNNNLDQQKYPITVAHFFKNGLNDVTVKDSVLTPYFIKTATTTNVTSINTSTDRILVLTTISENDNIYFEATTMPSPLDANKQYKAINVTFLSPNYSFQVAELGSSTPIDLTTTGSGVKVGVSDKKKYIQYDSEGYPSINLKWLIVKLGESIGININTTNVDNPLYSTAAKLDDLRLDTNMLFAINQKFAANSEYINSNPDLIENQINVFSLLSEIFSILSFYMKYTGSTGNKEFTIFAIPRDGSGNTLLSSTINYTGLKKFTDTSETVNSLNDFCFINMDYLRGQAGAINTIERSLYAQSTKTDFGDVTFGENEQLLLSLKFQFPLFDTDPIVPNTNIDFLQLETSVDSRPDLINQIANAQDISLFSNFWIFQSKESTIGGGNAWDIDNDRFYYFQSFLLRNLHSKVAFYGCDWTTENIETNIIDTESRVRRNEINPDRQTSIILQEIPSI